MNLITSSVQSGKHMEQLESRRLFASPVAVVAFADNRGEVQIKFDQPLRASTVNTRSVMMFLPGADNEFLTADDVKVNGRVRLITGGQRVWFQPNEEVPFPPGSRFAFVIKASRVRSAAGERIDGEWNGAGVPSGDGVAGGHFAIISSRDKGTNPRARFSTQVGNIDVELFGDQTPANVNNFLSYANEGSYDNTVIQRNLPNFIWQTGGYRVSESNTFDEIPSKTPVINEPSPTQATRGTISLARPDDNNPATDDRGTNQFFFNLVNNESNLGSQNGGFTEFGEVMSPAGLAAMDNISQFPTIDGDPNDTPGVFDDLAVQNSNVTLEDVDADPGASLVLIRRVAVRNKIAEWQI
jgi:cyclophilin family peptidyl-prolyl cis-trans isomerase